MINLPEGLPRLLVLLVLCLLLSACAGLPDHLVRQVEAMPTRLLEYEKIIAKRKSRFEAQKKGAGWAFASRYSEAERWDAKFDEAATLLGKARLLYETQLQPMAAENIVEDGPRFSEHIDEFNRLTREVTQATLYPAQRMADLLNARDNAEEIQRIAEKEMAEVTALDDTLTPRLTLAGDSYPHKADDISGQRQAWNAGLFDAETHFEKLSKQYDKHQLGRSADYAAFFDNARALSKQHQAAQHLFQRIESRVSELNTSYTRILADQRADYFVTVARADWCEGEHCGEGNVIRYPPVKVDEQAFEYFDSLEQDLIAELSGALWNSGFRLLIPTNYWQALNVDTLYRRSSGYDYAEYWIDEVQAVTYHRYTDVKQGKETTTDWVEVPESTYWNQFDNLGMALFTKPLGYYEEDSLTTAEPPGMGLIEEPVVVDGIATGSNQYGEWRESNGQSFWFYYAMYRLYGDLAGPRGYSYQDWRAYRDSPRGRPFYGRENQWGSYGPYTYSSSRYRDSDFIRRYPDAMTGARSPGTDSSIRSGGPSSRGRGPGGGGK